MSCDLLLWLNSQDNGFSAQKPPQCLWFKNEYIRGSCSVGSVLLVRKEYV